MGLISKFIKMGENLLVFAGTTGKQATTMQQMQAHMKQESETVGHLTDSVLWQPSTTYSVGKIVISPNMHGGYVAICIAEGQSGQNEPEWDTTATTYSDGTVRWEYQKLRPFKVNSSGAIEAPNISPDTNNVGSLGASGLQFKSAYIGTVYESGTSLANKYQAKGSYLTTHQDISGKADKVSITAGTAGTSSATSGSSIAIPYVTVNAQGLVTKYGTHTHTAPAGFGTGSSITVTASTQGQKDVYPLTSYRGSVDSTETATGSGNITSTRYFFNTRTGLGAGTYTLQNLLQHLVNRSHTHTISKQTYKYNCDCNCGD